MQVLREEFQRRKFGFTGVKAERICMSQWRMPVALYILYRFILMVYVIFWLGYVSHFHGNPPQAWGTYLTNWTYTLLAIYLTWHFLSAVVFHVQALRNPGPTLLGSCCAQPNPDNHQRVFVEIDSSVRENTDYEYIAGGENTSRLEGAAERQPPWYVCITWILFSAVSSGGFMVTIVFFSFLYPYMDNVNGIDLENLQVHLLNSVIIFLEHIVTGAPYRLLHFVYPFLYGLIYMTFSLIYWAIDNHHVMYPILDWSRPWPTVGIVFLIGFVLLPLFHTFFFLVYKTKMAVYRCLSV